MNTQFLQKFAVANSTFNDENSPVSERAKAAEFLFGGNTAFWEAIVLAMSSPKGQQKADATAVAPAVQAPPAQQQVSKPIAPPAPVSLKKPATGPARTLGVARTTKIKGDNPFVIKLAAAAVQLEHRSIKDHSPMGIFRTLMAEDGHGIEYYNACRSAVYNVLEANLVVEEADWKLLTERLKKNLFLGKEASMMFLESCPRDLIKDLLLGEGGVTAVVEQIRIETAEIKVSQYRIAFIMDCCLVVGREAKALLTNCKHAVNRMNQLGLIGPDHWLSKKALVMKTPRKLWPDVQYVSPEEVEALHNQEEPPIIEDKKLDKIQQMSEGAVVEASTEAVAEVSPAELEPEATVEEAIAESVAS